MAIYYKIQTICDPEVGGTTKGQGPYKTNESVKIEAIPNEIWEFDYWNKDNETIIKANPCTVETRKDSTYVAKFKLAYDIQINIDTTKGTATYIPYEDYIRLEATPKDGYILDGWYIGDDLIDETLSFNYSPTMDTTFDCRFIKAVTITTAPEADVCGKTYGDGVYEIGAECIIQTEANPMWVFREWYNGISDNPYKFEATEDKQFVAGYDFRYSIELSYDSGLGIATYNVLEDKISLHANVFDDVYFVGWYANSNFISDELKAEYIPIQDTTIEARFEKIYSIDTQVVGNGAISYQRGANPNLVTFSVLSDDNNRFVKYEYYGTEYYGLTLEIKLTSDITITAYFEGVPENSIEVISNIINASVFISQTEGYEPFTTNLWARPYGSYYFVKWDDGNTDNPRAFKVDGRIKLEAIYNRLPEDNNIIQYRCYIKDQMSLTDPPKAFLRVDSFDIKVDLLTNANSKINVISTPTDVNNGDVLVLYDNTGKTIYQGVIKSMEDTTINCSQMQSFYKGNWIYHVSPKNTLEQEISVILKEYADGKMYGSSWVDPLVKQRLGGITIKYVGGTKSKLPTDLDKDDKENYSIKDMESWIYSLYESYGIVFDFEINFSGANYVTIKVPEYSSIKVGNNSHAITDMSPITTIEETNRLYIYSKEKKYRTTYVATTSDIVEKPSQTVNRFRITNTKIVFSDDDVNDLVTANLPNTMYNHKLTFSLILKNFVYEFEEFKLGMPLEVWVGEDYYSTVLTGYEINKKSNENASVVNFTCGLVRIALTKLLTMGKI